MGIVKFANPYFGELAIDPQYRVSEYYPCHRAGSADETDLQLICSAVEQPIGCNRIASTVRKNDRVLILVDDHSRSTPVRDILPVVLAEVAAAGVPDDAVTILIALGTHRLMTAEEIKARVGPEIYASFRVVNHAWDEPENIWYVGKTSGGVEIWLNRLAIETDYIIGIGHIVPHRVAGYSGGGKIIQPGISGPETTGKTHWMSAYYSAEEILGKPDNPVRREIEEVAAQVAFRFIVNVVQDRDGGLAGVFAGHPIAAHRAGCAFAESIYGVAVEKADIVLAEAYPAESELWQATKALQAAHIAVKPGGVIVLIAECSEGLSRSHGHLIEAYGFRPLAEVESLIRQGSLHDLNVSSYLARVGNVLYQTKTILVSKGIPKWQGEKVGFAVCGDVAAALQQALAAVGPDPHIAVLHQGSELLPIVSVSN